jgi:aconitate hydratase
VQSHGLTGEEIISIEGLVEGVANEFRGGREVTVVARREDGSTLRFRARVRLDTPQEIVYYRHGGILQYVLRQLVQQG